MNYSEIEEGHIYNVEFDFVREYEFSGLHFALVLRKNLDRKTVIVAPLTSKDYGLGIWKYNLGIIKNLPSDVNGNNTYVVYNQIRTVCASRFSRLKNESKQKVDVKVEDEIYQKVIVLSQNELIGAYTEREKIQHYRYMYMATKIIVAYKLAESIVKLEEGGIKEKQIYITIHEDEIRDLLISENDREDYLDTIKDEKIKEIIARSVEKYENNVKILDK